MHPLSKLRYDGKEGVREFSRSNSRKPCKRRKNVYFYPSTFSNYSVSVKQIEFQRKLLDIDRKVMDSHIRANPFYRHALECVCTRESKALLPPRRSGQISVDHMGAIYNR